MLRGPILAVAPVLGEVRADLSFSAAQAGLLTSLPVLCFALVTPAAAALVARAGPDLATTVTLAGVVLGVVVRSAGGPAAVLAGTVLMGAAITVGNVVVPVLVRREVPPERARLTTALWTSALNLGTVVGTFVTAPLAEAAGWRTSLAWWVVLCLLVLAAWLVAAGRSGVVVERRPPAAAAAGAGAPAARALRRRDAATLAVLSGAFVGQAFAYYGVSTWLPTVLRDELGFATTAAGSAATVFQLLGLVGSLSVPLLAARVGLRALAVGMALTWLSTPLGLLLAPQGWLVWSVTGGVAQGAGLTLVFTLVVELARDGAHARRLSAVSQGVGYGVGGATAPALLGAAHDTTGSWAVPLLLVVAALVVFGALITWTVVRMGAPASRHPGDPTASPPVRPGPDPEEARP